MYGTESSYLQCMCMSHSTTFVWTCTDLIYNINHATSNYTYQLMIAMYMYLLYGSKEEDNGWKGKGNNIRLDIALPYIIPYPFQPISSSLLPYN